MFSFLRLLQAYFLFWEVFLSRSSPCPCSQVEQCWVVPTLQGAAGRWVQPVQRGRAPGPSPRACVTVMSPPRTQCAPWLLSSSSAGSRGCWTWQTPRPGWWCRGHAHGELGTASGSPGRLHFGFGPGVKFEILGGGSWGTSAGSLKSLSCGSPICTQAAPSPSALGTGHGGTLAPLSGAEHGLLTSMGFGSSPL